MHYCSNKCLNRLFSLFLVLTSVWTACSRYLLFVYSCVLRNAFTGTRPVERHVVTHTQTCTLDAPVTRLYRDDQLWRCLFYASSSWPCIGALAYRCNCSVCIRDRVHCRILASIQRREFEFHRHMKFNVIIRFCIYLCRTGVRSVTSVSARA